MKLPVRLTKSGRPDKRAAAARKMAKAMTQEERSARAAKGAAARWVPAEVTMSVKVPNTDALKAVLRRLGGTDYAWTPNDETHTAGTFNARTGALQISGKWKKVA